jgi:hypothetical protein
VNFKDDLKVIEFLEKNFQDKFDIEKFHKKIV